MYERIRNLREDHDLKQEDIARLLHCTQGPAIPITRPASGTSQRRCFTPWQTTTTSASTICWGEPAGKSRTLNNNRPRQAYRCRGFFTYGAPAAVPCGIFFVSRLPTAHFFAAGIPWNERQSSKFDIGGNFYVQQQRSVRLPEQQLVVDRHSDPPAVQLRRLERLREQQ